MAAGGGDADSRSLEQTPTWAFAIVCLGFVLISLFIERGIHLLAKWLKSHHKKALSEALEKIKAELMLLGFLSLLLTVGQKPISEICISESLGGSLLPCSKEEAAKDNVRDPLMKFSSVGHHRKLMLEGGAIYPQMSLKRMLADTSASGHCAKQGKVPLISQDGLHQLHIFIFVLAIFHVLSCIITLALGEAKMNQWKAWEQETKTEDYDFSNDPARFRFTRQTTFGKRHMNCWAQKPVLIWIVCFFRQFTRSVLKVDYLTLRHGFILAHFAPKSKFDFHKYIKRSLEDDFKVIVSISPPLWFFAVLFLLLNRHGWLTYFWLSFIPLIILLIVGTKLQVIITTMGLQIHDRSPVVQGPPVVKPHDKLFWFNRPWLILYLIHFTLFQNAFQIAFFFWAWYEYGLKSCFHEKLGDIVSRLCLGMGVQMLCSYVTLPLYALVTQMGTNMKTTIFDERIANSLKRWHRTAKKNLRRNKRSSNQFPSPSPSIITSGQGTPTHGFSPVHLLHKFKSEGDLQMLQTSSTLYHSEPEFSDMETPSPSHRNRQHATTLQNNTEADQITTEERAPDSNNENTIVEHLNNEREERQSSKHDSEANVSDFSFEQP